MTKPDLMAELAEVVRRRRMATSLESVLRANQDAADYLTEHHAELEAAVRDAAMWRHVVENTGDGLRVIVWKRDAPDDMDVLFPSPNLLKNTQYIDEQMHNSAREG